MLEFFENNKDLLNFLLALGTAIAGVLAGVVRWLFVRLQDEIKFSPATALGIGYFQNFVFKVGPEIARGTPILIDGEEVQLSRADGRIHIYLPEHLPGASHQGVEEYKYALKERGLRVVEAKVVTESRPFAFYAILNPGKPDTPPILFDYPTALGNMVEVLNYHLGEKVFSTESAKRLKLEKREIQNFATVVTKLIHDKNLDNFFRVTVVDPATIGSKH
jgi:hypothetical protein